MQESGEDRTRVATLRKNGAKQWARIEALKNHERENLDENRHL